MILDTEILFNVSNKNKSHLVSKGYDISQKTVKILIEDLPKFSHIKIRVKCDICKYEKELGYYKYVKNTKLNTEEYCCSRKCAVDKMMNTFKNNYGCVSSQHPDIKTKQEKTNIERYGNKSCQSNEIIKLKSYDTMIERYGVKYSYQNDTILSKFMSKIDETIKKTNKTKVLRGIMVDYENYSTYQEYRKLVSIETRKHKKKLYTEWNGLDYYDYDDIKENLCLESKDRLFPTIDHKISVLYGFKNEIDPIVIGSIENLCITKRTNNSKKNSRNTF
jgi:hypothetical protein